MKVELGSRVFSVSDDAAMKAEAMGLTADRLAELFRHSTRITHARGNRRTRDFVFMVQGSWILDLVRIDERTGQVLGERDSEANCKTCHDRKRVPVFNECEACDGKGCEKCDGGLVLASVPCPVCLIPKRKGVQ